MCDLSYEGKNSPGHASAHSDKNVRICGVRRHCAQRHTKTAFPTAKKGVLDCQKARVGNRENLPNSALNC